MEERLNYQLSDDDVIRIAGKDAKIVPYPDLKHYRTIEELFGHHKKVILLFLNERSENTMSGHWISLTKPNPYTVDFMDSYGLMPDSEKNWHTQSKNKQLGQEENHLTRLLYEFSIRPNHIVNYCEKRLQKMGGNISTCGRWTALKTRYDKIPIDDFMDTFVNLKKKGIDIDKLSVLMTDHFLK